MRATIEWTRSHPRYWCQCLLTTLFSRQGHAFVMPLQRWHGASLHFALMLQDENRQVVFPRDLAAESSSQHIFNTECTTLPQLNPQKSCLESRITCFMFFSSFSTLQIFFDSVFCCFFTLWDTHRVPLSISMPTQSCTLFVPICPHSVMALTSREYHLPISLFM